MAQDSRPTKRQLKKLVREQQGIVREDPDNLVARLKLAGALTELDRAEEALDHYTVVAEAYVGSGKLVQAISVYKGILEIRPGHAPTEAALERLSAQQAESEAHPEDSEPEAGSVHVPPDRVDLPPDGPSPPPPPPPKDALSDDGGDTAEQDMNRRVEYEDAELVIMAEVPDESERSPSDFYWDEEEEITSPGPETYDETIRQSALQLDLDVEEEVLLRRRVDSESGRSTLVGVPAAETPDLPETPLAPMPPVDQRRTIQMERPPIMEETDGAPRPEEETLDDVFDAEEEAQWATLQQARSDPTPGADPPEGSAPGEPSRLKPRGRPRRHTPTLQATPAPAPEVVAPASADDGDEAEGPRPGKARVGRKSSKMTIPMGAAAFKAMEEEGGGEEDFDAQHAETTGPHGPVGVQLEEIALFRDLSETSRETLQSRLVKRTEVAGTIIVREGDPGNALFVVSSGQVRVTKQDGRGHTIDLATLGPGSFFGEFALLSDRKRHATVTATRGCVLFEISRKIIADLTKSDPSFGNTLRQFYRRRLLTTLVRSAPFFDPLSDDERETLMGRLRFRRIPAGEKIVTEGEPGGGFFLILIGEVEVSKRRPDGDPKVLATLSDGSYFGEMSLLKGGNAVASVTTVSPTEIVQLAAAEFYRILSKYPQIWEEVNREAKRRELANLQILSGHTPDGDPADDSVVM